MKIPLECDILHHFRGVTRAFQACLQVFSFTFFLVIVNKLDDDEIAFHVTADC